MPGMDGLQALAAIKRNPRTAMIPVMMYTTKEGEVYVGQARALGGLGVLPKSVQPHVLFDMLLNLGLVKDKRTAAPPDVETPQRRATDTPTTANRVPEQRRRHRARGARRSHHRRPGCIARGTPQRTRSARPRRRRRGGRRTTARRAPAGRGDAASAAASCAAAEPVDPADHGASP